MGGAWSFAGAVLVGVIAAGVTLWTQRQGKKTQQTAIDATNQAAVMKAWQELLEPYRQEVARLDAKVTACDAKIAASEAKIAARDAKIDHLEGLMDNLEAWRARAVAYIRRLVDVLHANGIDPPDPPSGLDLG